MKNDKMMSLSSFKQEIKRLEATNEYHEAFMLCLNQLTNSECAESAASTARRLVKHYKYQVFKKRGKNYTITTKRRIDDNFLLDIAIEAGYKNVHRSVLSKGFLAGKIPCIILRGDFFSKHCYGWEMNKDNTSSTIYYRSNWACDDYKMITSISEKLIEMFY